MDVVIERLDKQRCAALSGRYSQMTSDKHRMLVGQDAQRVTADALSTVKDVTFSKLMLALPVHMGKTRIRYKDQLYSLAARLLMKRPALKRYSLESIAADILAQVETKKTPDWPALVDLINQAKAETRSDVKTLFRACSGVNLDLLFDLEAPAPNGVTIAGAIDNDQLPETHLCPYLDTWLSTKDFDTRFVAIVTCDRLRPEQNKVIREQQIITRSGSLDDVILHSLVSINQREPTFDDLESLHDSFYEKPIMLELFLGEQLIACATILSEVKTLKRSSLRVRECFTLDWIRLNPLLSLDDTKSHREMMEASMATSNGIERRELGKRLVILDRIVSLLSSPVSQEEMINKIYATEKMIGLNKTKNKHLSDDLGL